MFERILSHVKSKKCEQKPRVLPSLNRSFQSLVNQIFYSSEAEAKSRTLLFLGAARGVGVSFIIEAFTMYLCSTLKQRVLLIDANFTNPTLHTAFQCASGPGFSEYMAGEDTSDLIQETPCCDCCVMAPGDRDKLNASHLSLHRQDHERLALLARGFDLVLIDSEPITLTPEAFRLASVADGVILVAQAEKTAKVLATASKERLDQAGANLVGCILNRRPFHIPAWLYRFLR